MTNYVIDADNIGKKYIINHQNTGNATLVETLTRGGKNLAKRAFGKAEARNSTEEFWALEGVSFKIAEGDRLGIIGKNGAGKSTFLKILSRIIEPSLGKVIIKGRVASLLEVGTGFHPELTGRENIFLNGAILGMSSHEIRKKFDEIIQFAEIEKFLDTPVKRYSSGMYARLGFAIAAHLDPDLLIIDEVLAVGDHQFQQKCLKKLSELGQVGRTVLFVSHDVGNVLSLCNKGLWLEKGKVRYFGDVEECASEYMKTFKIRPLSWSGELGDEHIIFNRFEITPGDNPEYFYQNEKPEILLEYEVLKHEPELYLGFSVINERQQLIARSHTADQPQLMRDFSSVGKHKVRFTLNTSLFNEGEYYIRLECDIHNKKRILHDDIFLKFTVFSSDKDRYPHLGDVGGVYLGHHWKKEA